MRKRTKSAVLTALGCLALLAALNAGPPALAQSDPDRVADELAGLNRSVDRLVEMLERSIARQEIDLLLKRIELRERRLAPLERDLRGAEGELFDAKSEVSQMLEMQRAQEDEMRELERDGDATEAAAARKMLEDFERIILMQTTRMEDLQRRAMTLEDELADGRDEIAILDEMLLELLE